MYEGIRKGLRDVGEVNAGVSVPVAGGLAGAIAWSVSLPLDCVKTKIMSQVRVELFFGVCWVTLTLF